MDKQFLVSFVDAESVIQSITLTGDLEFELMRDDQPSLKLFEYVNNAINDNQIDELLTKLTVNCTNVNFFYVSGEIQYPLWTFDTINYLQSRIKLAANDETLTTRSEKLVVMLEVR